MQTANAARVQRCYRRKQQGLSVISIEVDEAALADELIASEFLHPIDADNRAALTKALERAVSIMITRGIK